MVSFHWHTCHSSIQGSKGALPSIPNFLVEWVPRLGGEKGKKGGKGGEKVGNGKQKRGNCFLKTPIPLYTIVLYQCNFNIMYSCCCCWMYDITHVLQLSQQPRGKSKLNAIKRRLSQALHIYKVYLLLQHTVCPRNIVQLVSIL